MSERGGPVCKGRTCVQGEGVVPLKLTARDVIRACSRDAWQRMATHSV